jgi:HEPN domain-containing protein
MNIEEASEWITIADIDFDSAKILNEAVRRHYEIICYHCAQAVEKYLKAYLVYQNVIPEKTHNLPYLNNHCIIMDNDFQNIRTVCAFLNRFANDIRYPHQYETTETDVNHALEAVEKIRNFTPVLELITMLDTLQSERISKNHHNVVLLLSATHEGISKSFRAHD